MGFLADLKNFHFGGQDSLRRSSQSWGRRFSLCNFNGKYRKSLRKISQNHGFWRSPLTLRAPPEPQNEKFQIGQKIIRYHRSSVGIQVFRSGGRTRKNWRGSSSVSPPLRYGSRITTFICFVTIWGGSDADSGWNSSRARIALETRF